LIRKAAALARVLPFKKQKRREKKQKRKKKFPGRGSLVFDFQAPLFSVVLV
jgi:hypothetical protein